MAQRSVFDVFNVDDEIQQALKLADSILGPAPEPPPVDDVHLGSEGFTGYIGLPDSRESSAFETGLHNFGGLGLLEPSRQGPTFLPPPLPPDPVKAPWSVATTAPDPVADALRMADEILGPSDPVADALRMADEILGTPTPTVIQPKAGAPISGTFDPYTAEVIGKAPSTWIGQVQPGEMLTQGGKPLAPGPVPMPDPSQTGLAPLGPLGQYMNEGFSQVGQGLKGAIKSAVTPPAGAVVPTAPGQLPPTQPKGASGYFNPKTGQWTQPAAALAPETMAAGSDVIEGTFKVISPLLLAAGANAPAQTIYALAKTVAAQKFAEAVVEYGGASEEAQRLAGNLAAASAGLIEGPDLIAAAKRTGRAAVLTARLGSSGYGTGDVPGYRGAPYSEGRGVADAPTGKPSLAQRLGQGLKEEIRSTREAMKETPPLDQPARAPGEPVPDAELPPQIRALKQELGRMLAGVKAREERPGIPGATIQTPNESWTTGETKGAASSSPIMGQAPGITATPPTTLTVQPGQVLGTVPPAPGPEAEAPAPGSPEAMAADIKADLEKVWAAEPAEGVPSAGKQATPDTGGTQLAKKEPDVSAPGLPTPGEPSSSERALPPAPTEGVPPPVSAEVPAQSYTVRLADGWTSTLRFATPEEAQQYGAYQVPRMGARVDQMQVVPVAEPVQQQWDAKRNLAAPVAPPSAHAADVSADVSATQPAGTAEAAQPVSVKRASNFSDSGEYVVSDGTNETRIHRDPESGWWYRIDPTGTVHYSERVAGFNKKEAVESVVKRWADRPAVKQPVAPADIVKGPDAEAQSAQDAASPGEGVRPGDGASQSDVAPGRGLQSPGSGRPGRAEGEREPTRAERDDEDIAGLVREAAEVHGHTGDPEALHAELSARLQAHRELDAEMDELGTNPLVLLRAIAKGGGISEEKETGQKGEIVRLKEYLDTRSRYSGKHAKGDLAKMPVLSGFLAGQVRGVRGVYRDDGLTLDGMVEYLSQDPRFRHITGLRELVAAIETASQPDTRDTVREDKARLQSLRNWLATKPWDRGEPGGAEDEDDGDISFDPNEFGEEQGRLPEAGAVRDVEVKAPEFEAPYSLEREVAKGSTGNNTADLFAEDLKALRGGVESDKPLFSRREEPAPAHAPAKERSGFLVVSTRVPNNKNPEPRKFPLDLSWVKAIKEAPEYPAKLAAKIGTYPQVRESQRGTTQQILDAFSEVGVGNIIALWDWLPKAERDAARVWYEGAHSLADEMTDLAPRLKLRLEQATVATAVQSPQKVWNENVSLAARVILIVADAQRDNPTFSKDLINVFEEMTRESIEDSVSKAGKAARKRVAKAFLEEHGREPADAYLTKIQNEAEAAKREKKEGQLDKQIAEYRGRTWRRLSFAGKAALLRAIDKTTHQPFFREIFPDGTIGDWVRNDPEKGQTVGDRASVSWGTYGMIAKAIEGVLDGSDGAIHRLLGDAHKVRSFYNNIVDPNSPVGHTTVDVQALAALFLQPLATKGEPILDFLTGGVSNAAAGLDGAYVFYQEIYRRAAEALTKRDGVRVRPREIQSVVWEAVRKLFPPEGKRDAALKTQVQDLWDRYAQGKISADAVRRQVIAAGEAYAARRDATKPAGRDVRPDAAARVPDDQGRVSRGVPLAGRPGVPVTPRPARPDTARPARPGPGVGLRPELLNALPVTPLRSATDSGVVAVQARQLLNAFNYGDDRKFTPRELQFLADALDVPLISLTSTMGAGSPEELVDLVDEAGGVEVLDDAIWRIAEARVAKTALPTKGAVPVKPKLTADRILEGARGQRALMQKTWDKIETHQIRAPEIIKGARDMAVIDSGSRLFPQQLAHILQDPSLQRVMVVQLEVLERIIAMMIRDWSGKIVKRGLLFELGTYGLFLPNVGSPEEAAIFLNPFEAMIDWKAGPGKLRTPEDAADHTFVTMVHETLHHYIPFDGPQFEEKLAEILNGFDKPFRLAATKLILEAYAAVGDQTQYRPGLRALLPIYQQSRRRAPREEDAISASGYRSERPPDERGAKGEPGKDLRPGRGRTVSEAELKALAEKQGTTVEAQRTRAQASGYTIDAAIIPGARQFVERDVAPALKTAFQELLAVKTDVQAILAPDTISDAATVAANVVRTHKALEAQELQKAARLLDKLRTQWDRMPQADQLAFAMAVDEGDVSALPVWQREAATLFADINALFRQAVRDRGGFQRGYIEDYYPRQWERSGRVRQYVRGGLSSKRPFKGWQGFKKARARNAAGQMFSFREMYDAGFRPVHYNPVEAWLAKWDEMRKWISAYDILREHKAVGITKYVPVDNPHPRGWIRYPESYGTVYGKAAVTVAEAFDPAVRKGLEQLLKDLEVRHRRPVNVGIADAWGYARGDKDIVSKFGGPEGVIMHELGHILDYRYGLWQAIVNPAPRESYTAKKGKKAGVPVMRAVKQDKATVKVRVTIKKELRALADLRYEGTKNPDPGYVSYVRNQEEQMANLVHAFLYAPQRAKEVAPQSYWALFNVIKAHPELEPLHSIQQDRGMRLQSDTREVTIPGQLIAGHYYGPPEAVRIMEHYLSPGLARYRGYRAFRYLGGAMTQVQLGLSAFHLAATGIEAVVAKTAVGLERLSRGDVLEGLKDIAISPAAPFISLWTGGQALKALRTQTASTQDFANIASQIIQAGGREGWDPFWHNQTAVAKWLTTWRNMIAEAQAGNYPGAALRMAGGLLRTFPVLIEAQMKPVMEYWVPRMKMAAFLDMARLELDDLGQQPVTVEGRKALAKAWDSVDNRFGELVYDNLFWDRRFKDFLLAMMRAPGWSLGTWRELFMAIPDQVGHLVKLSGAAGGGNIPMRLRHVGTIEGPEGETFPRYQAGREPWLTHKFAYFLSILFWISVYGAMTQYLHTGLKPGEQDDGSIDPNEIPMDLFFPRREKDQGTWKRVILPTQLRDVWAAVHNFPYGLGTMLGHKLNPLVGAIVEFVKNEDYWGTEIHSETDTIPDQVKDALTQIGKGLEPISIQSMQQSGGHEIESFVGIVPAPAYITRTKLESYLRDVAPPTHRTKAQGEAAAARRALRAEARTDDLSAMREQGQAAIEAGTLTPRQVADVMRQAGTAPIVFAFQRLDAWQALHAYELATPTERRALKTSLERKLARASIPVVDQPKFKERKTRALELSVAGAPLPVTAR